jgi:hypothetical protein
MLVGGRPVLSSSIVDITVAKEMYSVSVSHIKVLRFLVVDTLEVRCIPVDKVCS